MNTKAERQQTMVITGAAQGLGRQFTEYFLSKNYRIVVLDFHAAALEQFGQEYKELQCYCVDLTNAQQVESTFAQIGAYFANRIDILVNNAGFICSEPMVNLANLNSPYHRVGQFEEIIKGNLTSTFLTTRYALPYMVEHRQGGLILNLSSIAAHGNSGQTAYSAAKAGVDALTEVWAHELAQYGIRTVGIAPGYVTSDSLQVSLSESKREEWIQRIPLKRFANPEDIIQALQFAIDNPYLNGTTIAVNGGLRLP